MSNFYPSGISCLTYCVATNAGFVMQFAWTFLKIFKYNFHQGNLRKIMKKIFLRKQQYSDLCEIFF